MKDSDIKRIREVLNLTQEELAQKIGVSRNTIINYEKGGVIPESKRKLLTSLLEVSALNIDISSIEVRGDTIVAKEVGTGNIIYGKATPSSKDLEEAVDTSIMTGKVIPLFDAEAAAGTSYGMDMDAVSRPIGMIEIGGLLKDSESALRVYGNSMVPNYPAGCVLGLRPHYDSFIEPGRVYVVETDDNRYLKRLYSNKDKTALRCVSDNHMVHDGGPMKGEFFYPDFEIPLSEVRRLFRVVGVIKRNSL